jgi:ABC-2 type transport system ATP-binding protein
MNDAAVIQIQGVHKHYGQVQAIAGVTESIQSGQIYGLLGPNGAGKTTLIRLLIGSTKPTSGQMAVLGFDPVRQKRALRRLIGYMPQTPALYDDLTARENISFFTRSHQIDDISQKVDRVIEFVGLSDRAQDQVYKFSGGMKQRVSLACALVHEPQLLFLDEPTSGIDPKLREAFWQHFQKLAASGVTIILSTHQMDEAMNCDRLAVLHRGVVMAEDSPRQLLANSRARITIWKGEQNFEHQTDNYQRQLPRVLQQYGLDKEITQIEIKEDTLETVVLGMINAHEEKTGEEEAENERGI